MQDDWADKDKHFTEGKKKSYIIYDNCVYQSHVLLLIFIDETFHHHPDSWNDIGTNLYGNLKQLYLLKQRNRSLKVSLSVGGWSWSTNFTTVAQDPVKRARFAESALQHVQDYGLDGLDVDWEHPKDDQEAQAYVDLLHDLREKLTDQYLISVAVSSGAEVYRKMHLKEMAQYVDFFYIMAYDLAGAWDSVIGHQAPLYGKLSVKSAIEDYIAAGVPAQKIIMGIPAYGRGFKNVKSAKPGSSFNGVPKGSWEEGSFDYKDLPRPGATEHVDDEAMASYSYDPKKQEFVTYDNPFIVEKKCDLVRELGLGGVMFWELSADYHGSEDRSLLYAASRAFDGNIDTTPNHLDYPNSRFDNIRNKMQS